MIYFDNAATGFPKDKAVIQAVKTAIIKSGNPGRSGHKYSIYASELLYSAREELAKYFNTTPEKVILCPSATYALNIAIKGLYKKDKKILISDLEHNSVIRPAFETGETIIFETDINNDIKTIDNFKKKLIDNDIGLVVITHASNVCGRILPIEELSSICYEKNISFILDASQTAGYISLSLLKSQIDVICIPGHKGLYGPMGTGALLINPKKEYNFKPLIQGGTGILSTEISMPEDLPEKLEAGTFGVQDFAGLSMAVKIRNNEKFEKNKYFEKYLFLIEELDKIPELTLYGISLENIKKYVPVILFNHKKIISQDFSDLLHNKGICVRSGFHCAPFAHKKLKTGEYGAVRLSLGKNNTMNECETAIQIIKKLSQRWFYALIPATYPVLNATWRLNPPV